MLEPVVGRPWEDKVAAAELLDEPEPLELRCVYDSDQEGVESYMAVDWIIEYLQKKNHTG